MKILTIIGARPQFIKAATVSREIKNHPSVTEVIVHTGQHYDANMSDIFFEQLDIPRPDYYLEVSSLSHGAMTGRMLEKAEELLLKEKPNWVLVYGDTNSTLAGALAASKLHMPVAHVEAGLRSFNKRMPEEINRILTDNVSDVLFCPTDEAIKNLNNEGFATGDAEIIKCGDVMLDAALYYSDKAQVPQLDVGVDFSAPFVLATIHRAENTDDPSRLEAIVGAISEIHQEMPVLLPLHPRTQRKLKDAGLQLDAHVIDPVGYLEMVYLLKKSAMVMTDSGGLQKEAFFFNKPCVTFRDQTEWVELIEIGANKLAGADKDEILTAYTVMRDVHIEDTDTIYGSGDAAERIVEHLKINC